MKNKGFVAIGAIAVIIVLTVYLIFSITLGSWNPSKWEFSEETEPPAIEEPGTTSPGTQQPGTTLPGEQEPGEQEPGEESYKISILKDGDANSLTQGIMFNCPKRAKRFEIVKLEVVITDPNYTVTGIEMQCNTSAAVETEIKRIGENTYQFQMPKDDIDIFVYFKFELQSPEEPPDTQEPNPAHYWQIGYGTLSDGGVGEEITLNCPPHAKAGETVSFTVTAADPEAFISGVMLSAADNPDWTDDDDYYIEPDEQGVYKFQMPACDIRLTIYLINIKDA